MCAIHSPHKTLTITTYEKDICNASDALPTNVRSSKRMGGSNKPQQC